MRLTLLVLLMTIGALLLAPASAASYRRGWVPTWTTSPEPADPDSAEPLLHLQDQTVRERVRVSISGAQIRLRLSNEFGTAPLRLGSVAVAMPLGAAGIRPGTLRAVTFGGRASVTLAPGAPLLSDPVSFSVGAGSEISISIYFPDRGLERLGMHLRSSMRWSQAAATISATPKSMAGKTP